MKINENYKNRRQVSRDEIFDILNQQDDYYASNGKFASVTYVKPAAVYKKKNKRTWRNDDVVSALDKYKDRSEEEWHQKLSNFTQDDVKGNNPLSSGVVVARRWLLHWCSPEKYKKDYAKYAAALHDLRMQYRMARDSDGMLGDNHNQRQKSDYGPQFNQTGKLSRDFNTKGSKVKTTAYFCGEDGHIKGEFPEEVLNSMLALKKPKQPEKEARDMVERGELTPEELEAYWTARQELDKTFGTMNLVFDQILSIAASVNGESYYYINDKLLTPLVKDGEVCVNQEEMVQIAADQLKENFNDIMRYDK